MILALSGDSDYLRGEFWELMMPCDSYIAFLHWLEFRSVSSFRDIDCCLFCGEMDRTLAWLSLNFVTFWGSFLSAELMSNKYMGIVYAKMWASFHSLLVQDSEKKVSLVGEINLCSLRCFTITFGTTWLFFLTTWIREGLFTFSKDLSKKEFIVNFSKISWNVFWCFVCVWAKLWVSQVN